MDDAGRAILDNVAGDLLTAFHKYNELGRIPSSSEAARIAHAILQRVADIADAIDLKEGYASDVAEFLRALECPE